MRNNNNNNNNNNDNNDDDDDDNNNNNNKCISSGNLNVSHIDSGGDATMKQVRVHLPLHKASNISDM
jgi:hypothetical protein